MTKKALTIFQKSLPNDKETCRRLLRLFHPDYTPNDKVLAKMCRIGSYEWVEIYKHACKDYGCISILIDNGNTGIYFTGPNLKREDVEASRTNDKMQFKVWRCILDCRFKQEGIDTLGNWEVDRLRKQYTEILRNAGYDLQTTDEYIYHYFED